MYPPLGPNPYTLSSLGAPSTAGCDPTVHHPFSGEFSLRSRGRIARDSRSRGDVHHGIDGIEFWRYEVKSSEIDSGLEGAPQQVNAS